MKKYIITSVAVAFATPFLAMAAVQVNNISGVGSFIINTINGVFVPVLMSIAFIVFIYGIFSAFILNSGDEEKRKKGKMVMMYGLIGFAVMVSVWGLVNVFTGSVGLNSNVTSPISGMHVTAP